MEAVKKHRSFGTLFPNYSINILSETARAVNYPHCFKNNLTQRAGDSWQEELIFPQNKYRSLFP
jgi:hypothetical protein